MRKNVIMVLMILLTTFIFGNSMEIVEKINSKMENLKGELGKKLEENGINYQIAGSFSVEESRVKIEAYAIPNAGENLVTPLKISEIRDRNNLDTLIKRESSLPESPVKTKFRGAAELTALVLAMLMAGVLLYRKSDKIKINENKEEKKAEKEEEKKAA